MSSWLWRYSAASLFVATAWASSPTPITAQLNTISHLDSANIPVLIDAFESIAGWRTTAADGVTLRVALDAGLQGKAMRVVFDFQGHRGYAIVSKSFNIALPANYGSPSPSG